MAQEGLGRWIPRAGIICDQEAMVIEQPLSCHWRLARSVEAAPRWHIMPIEAVHL